MADWVWKGVYRQLSLNKFFDTSTPSMRKVDDGKKRKENTSLAAPGAHAHLLQRCTVCKIKMAARGVKLLPDLHTWLHPLYTYGHPPQCACEW